MTETATLSLTDVPQVYKRHVFACFQQRPPTHPRGSCGAAGAQPLWERLGKQIEATGQRDIVMTATGCMGFCQAGPIMVVYPEGVWYQPRTPEDVDEIVTTHLVGGTLVERLVIVPRI
ncbi:ferredoxin [Azorhizobium caulinodans ORS 571]|uniref:Ferredoxin n=1 Tax=Azorhizobium caulinodans (strain ATCC 43989 / DSM 5975 / JCM 20966 / LMG 6465 / NBRC 14845 / NCIMB 13405 / ORS 571) TaxID=438753 RepID=A8IJG9_AZOC5|nr:(2Fe-2S) ferredoxin domain-containing protein [Azorhizobium caulinodans]BAF86301.1 ferredoxin [Azorhizobium caulinodans ORS 571]